MSIKILLHLIKADLVLFLRARVAVFWTFAFPLLMLVMQMALFGHDTKLGPISLAIIDNDHSTESANYIRQLNASLHFQNSIEFQILPANSPASSADLAVTIPAGFARNVAQHQTTELELGGKQNGGPASDAAYGMIRGMSDAYNLNGLNTPPRVSLPPPKPHDGSMNYGLFLVTGLTGMIILSSGLMGFAGPLVAAREGGMFRLYQLFPMRTSTVILAWWMSRLVITALASLAMILVGWLIYGVHFSTNPAAISLAILMLVLGTGAFLSLGMLIASLCPNVASVTMICNLLYFPLMFAGNLMIPLGGLPKFVQKLLAYMPLNAMVASLRDSLTDAANWHAILYSGSASIVILLICLGLSARHFSWVPRG